MPDGFGLVNSVLSPHLERVAKEERLGRDHPRKNRDGRPERAREDAYPAQAAAGEPEEEKTSMSSTHIDLRI
jgi:hypothetical protein